MRSTRIVRELFTFLKADGVSFVNGREGDADAAAAADGDAVYRNHNNTDNKPQSNRKKEVDDAMNDRQRTAGEMSKVSMYSASKS